jgi:RadC-like JAB domain
MRLSEDSEALGLGSGRRCCKYPHSFDSGSVISAPYARDGARVSAMSAPRLAHADPAFTPCRHESELVSELVRPHFGDHGEWLIFFCFDALGRLVAACENGGYSRSSAVVTPVMVRAIVASGHDGQLLIAHNHPSGELKPSAHDIALTSQIAAFCALSGIAVSDHLILTRAGHFSFRQAGLL